MSESFSISELAREFAITARAIRFYEDKQLLNPARVGNTRVYSRADRTRLKLVMRGKRLGWPLDEIKRVIELYDGHSGVGEQLQLEAMLERLEQTREQLLAQQQDLLQTLGDIEELESNCREQLESIRHTDGLQANRVFKSANSMQIANSCVENSSIPNTSAAGNNATHTLSPESAPNADLIGERAE